MATLVCIVFLNVLPLGRLSKFYPFVDQDILALISLEIKWFKFSKLFSKIKLGIKKTFMSYY